MWNIIWHIVFWAVTVGSWCAATVLGVIVYLQKGTITNLERETQTKGLKINALKEIIRTKEEQIEALEKANQNLRKSKDLMRGFAVK
jgi:chemotaxis signal transduction protein